MKEYTWPEWTLRVGLGGGSDLERDDGRNTELVHSPSGLFKGISGGRGGRAGGGVWEVLVVSSMDCILECPFPQ